MVKKARATMPMDSRHVRPERCQCRSKNKCQQIIPIAMILDANCHVAALRLCQPLSKSPIAGYNAHLKASDTQYAMKLVTPHFRSCLGTGSMSLFVLENISMQPTIFHRNPPSKYCQITYHRAFPSAKVDTGCSTFNDRLGRSMPSIV